jgi:hypothetical protein
LDTLVTAPFEQGGIDKFAAVVTVNTRKREREGGFNIQQGLENPSVGFVEGRTQFNPAGIRVGGGKGEAELP